MKLAIDSETTGLYIKHGCRPFMVTGCDENGDTYCWEWQVNPKTRIPIIPRKHIVQITELVNDAELVVLHNSKFDLHGLESIGIKLPSWTMINDTITQCHVLDSSERQALKPMAAKYANFPIEDEKNLHRACVRARNYAKKIGWAIASADHPHFKPVRNRKTKSGAGWPASDMWLPRQFALWDHEQQKPRLSDEEYEEWISVCRTYAIGDAVRTMMVYLTFEEAIEEEKLTKQYLMQRAALAPLYSMERHGFPLIPSEVKSHRSKLRTLRQKHQESATFIAQKATGQKSFNIQSGQQVKRLLYDVWKLPVIKRTKPSPTCPKGNPSSDFDTMLKLAFGDYPAAKKPHVQKYLKDHLHFSKFKTAETYLDSYDSNRVGNRLYATANNQGTATTRVSFRNPNLQNIGKGGASSGSDDLEIQMFLEELASDNESLRGVFGPEEGTIWYDIDYSQLQLRIFAFVADEHSLIEAFARGWDAHTFVARKIFGLRDDEEPTKLQRRIAKNVNFGFVFGASPRKIEQTAGRPGLWGEVIKLFPSAHKFMEATKRQVKRRGFVLTPGGYRLTCDKEHKGVNYIVQGSEGELVKRAMIETYRYTIQMRQQKKADLRLLLQVHDELVFAAKRPEIRSIDVPKKDNPEKMDTRLILPDTTHLRKICSIMEDAGRYYGMETPVDPEIVLRSWNKSYKLLECIACGGSGVSSSGRRCVPCQINLKRAVILND